MAGEAAIGAFGAGEETSPPAERKPAAAAVDEEVFIELPAPPGWTKKFIPSIRGTPRRNEILFISPIGEKIKNKPQLHKYLRSHPGGPSSSEFDWGTGDTPRRSTRISQKGKASESPEREKSAKRERQSISNDKTKASNHSGLKISEKEKVSETPETKKPKKSGRKSISKTEAKHTNASADELRQISEADHRSATKTEGDASDELKEAESSKENAVVENAKTTAGEQEKDDQAKGDASDELKEAGSSKENAVVEHAKNTAGEQEKDDPLVPFPDAVAKEEEIKQTKPDDSKLPISSPKLNGLASS